jgi:hypothetical protein
LEELRAGMVGEADRNSTLEQVFLSIVGQSRADRAHIEELSWLT